MDWIGSVEIQIFLDERKFLLGMHTLHSKRFVVKPEGGQQCIFDVFLSKPVGGQCKLGGWEAPEGG